MTPHLKDICTKQDLTYEEMIEVITFYIHKRKGVKVIIMGPEQASLEKFPSASHGFITKTEIYKQVLQREISLLLKAFEIASEYLLNEKD